MIYPSGEQPQRRLFTTAGFIVIFDKYFWAQNLGEL